MLDTIRRYVDAGREALTPEKAEQLARALVKQGQVRKEQAEQLARDLLEWSRKGSERFLTTIRREVKRQVQNAGVATKDEVESLKRRIRDLERSGGRKASAAAPRRKASSAKTTSARGAKRTARKPTSGRPPASGPTPPPSAPPSG